MPLTPAHAAAAWPLHALLRGLPLDALVIGTLSPDFEYLFRLAPRARIGHSLAGVGLFCLPVSLAAWGLFRALVRPALVRLLPPALAVTVADPPPAPVLRVAVAILLGALSHVAWDGATHRDGWVVLLVPVLPASVGIAPLAGVRWYRVLQHASTVGGLAAVGVWIAGWLRAQPPAARRYHPAQWSRVATVAARLAGATALGALANGARGLGGGAARASGSPPSGA
jgi:hypothetical protein